MNLPKIVLEKEEYTISEIIDIVADYFEIETRDEEGNVNQTHKTIYKRIERALENVSPVRQTSDRKKYYTKGDFDALVNYTLYKYFCEKASDEMEERLKKFQQRAENTNKELMAYYNSDQFLLDLQKMKTTGSDGQQEAIDEWYNQKRLEILFDFVTRYFIDIDNEQLKNDINTLYVADDLHTDVHIEEAKERYNNIRNYYSVKDVVNEFDSK